MDVRERRADDASNYGNAGGFKRTIHFARDGADTFTCKIEAAYLREDGVGRVATRSAIDNVPFTILSAKQVSSSCKVSKSPAGLIPNQADRL